MKVRKVMNVLLASLLGVTLASLLLTRELPSLEGRGASIALADTGDSSLGRAFGPAALAHPGQSGVLALTNGRDAFAARALLARDAERSIDAQYYIWHDDMAGRLLFEEIRTAADRGVRVRLLLDDNTTVGMDPLLASLDAHPGIEIRLFNPFMHRGLRALGFLTDFDRLNRRMHNKAFTVDNQVTIIGGRNVGDEYFDAGDQPLFVDVDVVAVGAVVREVSSDFDRYWASNSAYPIDRILPSDVMATSGTKVAAEAPPAHGPQATAYLDAVAASPFIRDMRAGSLPLEWTTVRMVSDDPAKGLGRAPAEASVIDRLAAIIGDAVTEVRLVSPYFVPTAEGVDALAAIAARGVDIAILTNSLEATDVAAVHAGYAGRREPLLAHGIALYELKRRFAPRSGSDRGLPGSSAASLHAKTFAIDRERIFIGSFNFDPRSARLNTENGFVIDSTAMATVLAGAFETRLPETAYAVQRSADGSIEWVDRSGSQARTYDKEPGVGFWHRNWVRFLSLLPIEGLL